MILFNRISFFSFRFVNKYTAITTTKVANRYVSTVTQICFKMFFTVCFFLVRAKL